MGRKQRWLTGAGVGAVVSAMAAANVMAANINVTVKNASGPVSVATTGTNTVTVTVTNKGSVTNPSGPAITVTAQQGAIAVTDNGAVSASGDGIYATNTSADGVSITVNQSLQASGIAGVSAFDNGAGAAGVTIGSGGKGNPLTIASPQIVDAVAISGSGPASVTAGNNDSFTAGAPGVFQAANLAAVGLVTSSNPGGGPALSITTGRNDTFVLQGNNSAAIAAHTGVAGSFGPNGSASVGISVSDGVSIHVSGLSDAGVIGFVADPASGKFSGTGDVSVIVGKGQITVDETGAVGVPTGAATNSGIVALSGGGNVLIDDGAQVNVSGGKDQSIGLLAVTAGAGTATINARASVTSANGDAIKAQTTNGANTINVMGGDVSSTGGDGVDAISNGAGPILVTTAAGTDVKTTTPGGFFGILATGGMGDVSISAVGTVSEGGIKASTGGAGNVTVKTGGAVTNTAGVGISAAAASGQVTVVAGGPITASAGGIFAQGDGPEVIAVANGSVSAGGTDGVEALNVGAGAATAATGSGTGKMPLTIAGPTVAGIVAVSVDGSAAVNLGDHNTITISAPGSSRLADAASLALFTPADTAGPSTSVVAGSHDTFDLQCNGSAAISAQTGQAGLSGPSGTASSFISIGNDVSIHVSGLSDAGVIGFVTDPSGLGQFAGTGDVSVTVGTGSIVVDEAGAVGSPSGTFTNVGVAALSAGGNVLVDDAAKVVVSGGQDTSVGIEAITSGSGTATINARASVSSANGDAIRSRTNAGANTVSVLSGQIVSMGGSGIYAATSGSGTVTVTTAVGTDVRSTRPGFAGIAAQSGLGDTNVFVNGTISDGGISASANYFGDVTVVTTGAVANTTGAAISAGAAFGHVNVTVLAPLTAAGDGLFARSDGGTNVFIGADVSVGGPQAVESFTLGSGPASVVISSGTKHDPLTITNSVGAGVLALDFTGPASIVVGDHVSVTAGLPGVASLADASAVNLFANADQGATPSASVVAGDHDTFALRGNQSAAIAAQVGVAAQSGPNGSASVAIEVGDDVSVHASGLSDAGVIGFVADPSGARALGGSGNVSITVGTGVITVDEVGATGTPQLAKTNSGIDAISYGGNILIDDSAAVVVSGGQDASLGLIAYTAKAGTVTINARASVTSLNGNGVQSTTGDGANTVNIFAGTVSAPTASGVDIVTHGAGASSLNVSAGAAVSGLTGVTISSANLATIDNQGTITGGAKDHSGQAVSVIGAGGLTLTNEAAGVLDGRVTGADSLTVDNAGFWQTKGTSDFGTAGGAASNTLNNTGTIEIGQSGPTNQASAVAFLDLGAFNNGSAAATGLVTMVNGKVGDTLTVGGPFVGAPGNSILALDAFLGGPGSTADQLILLGGSAGQTLIRIKDVNKGPGALNPDGIVLVQGASAAGDFALDPSQPHYDPILHGIDKGLFVYPLAYVGTNEELVGVPGAPALQLATMASAAEQVWSSTSPGGDSAESLRASFASGGDGPRVWAKALNGGASRLNAGRTLMGEAGFASQPDVGPPMSVEVSGAATVSAFGMTYGFNTSYAQNTSALITGVDFGRHVGQRSAWSWGLSTAYLESQQSFSQSSALALYSGAMAALHGAFIAGGFYVDGDAKLTMLKVSYASVWPGAGAPGASITTFGGEAEAGWRAALGGGWRLEPSGSLSVQSSSLGALTVAGTAVRFGAADSIRVGLGAKLEGGWRLFGAELKSDTALRFWDELAGANVLDLGGSGAGYALPDQIGGAFADASEALSLESRDGKSSAFVSGAYRWKSNYQAAQIAAGVKLRW